MVRTELYFVAFFKHGAPQLLVSGPYIDWQEANSKAEEHPQHCVVKTTLDFVVCS